MASKPAAHVWWGCCRPPLKEIPEGAYDLVFYLRGLPPLLLWFSYFFANLPHFCGFCECEFKKNLHLQGLVLRGLPCEPSQAFWWIFFQQWMCLILLMTVEMISSRHALHCSVCGLGHDPATRPGTWSKQWTLLAQSWCRNWRLTADNFSVW